MAKTGLGQFFRPSGRLPLRTLLIVPFVLQVSLAVGLTGLLSVRNSQRAVNTVASQLRQEIVNRIEQKLHDHLRAPQLVNQLNLNAIRLGYLQTPDLEAFFRHFQAQSQQFPTVESIFFGRADGEFIGYGTFNPSHPLRMQAGPSLGGNVRFYALDDQGQVTGLDLETPGWNTQSRPWYAAAVQAGKPAWGDIFTYHAFPMMAIPAVVPVYDGQNNLLGVLGCNFFLAEISSFLKTLKVGQAGQTFIVEHSGLLVASSTVEQPFEVIAGKPQRIEATQSEEPLISGAAQFLVKRYGGFDRIHQPAQLEFWHEGARQFLQVASYHDEHGLDWLIVVVVPEADFMAEIEANTRTTLLLCLLALVGAIASGLLTSRWILRPISQLSEASIAIAQGDLDQSIAPNRLRELTSLATAFNLMADRLEASFSDLRQSKAELEQVNLELKEQATLFRLIAENMSDLVCLHDPDGCYRYVSPSVQWLLGFQPQDLVGKNPFDFFHPQDCDRIRLENHRITITGMPRPITYRMRQRSGHYIWLETITRPIFDSTGATIRLQSASRDVTEKIRMQKQLEHDALHDGLTGLPNRNLIIERVNLALDRSQRQPTYQFAVLFLDLDRFKVVNDSLGHLAGDELLVEIACRLKTVLRSIDLAARLGGDEFIVLLESISGSADAIRIAERIFEQMQAPLVLAHQDVFVNASIGIVLGSERYHEAQEILRDADTAMYRAKAKGRARYEIFDPAMHLQALERLQLENDLRKALLESPQELLLYYQPIIDLQTNRLKGFETLIRWQHPLRGLLPPGEFIPLAEETGFIVALGQWILRAACQQLKTWQAQLPQSQTLTLSVNLSALQLHSPTFLHEVDQILRETGLQGETLIFEITESMLVENINDTISLLHQLRERGISLSIDDFGTGYSSLSYLYRFPVRSLKIDKSFVSGMMSSATNHRIVETIITLAHQLQFQVIAEGIESLDQVEQLKLLHCEFGQGYFLGRPSPVETAQKLIDQWS
ncbi:MAG: EAL domain-containing protein [Cyanobacteria bacterium Co-bin8]|nr:EAL domain-containing protein [Cyanobacteria bacterium Co-bin8]